MIGVVVGLKSEARLARPWTPVILAGGGKEPGAALAADALADREAITGLISFGLAGGLDPSLRPGDLLVPTRIVSGTGSWLTDPALCAALGGATGHTILGGGPLLATIADKTAARMATGAHAVDLESAAVARAATRRGIPFATLRAICDGAGRTLPRAAVVALDHTGRIQGLRVLGAVLSRPWQLPALLALARDTGRAGQALAGRVAVTPAVSLWP